MLLCRCYRPESANKSRQAVSASRSGAQGVYGAFSMGRPGVDFSTQTVASNVSEKDLGAAAQHLNDVCLIWAGWCIALPCHVKSIT